jgi:cytoskeleton protein RodZ
MAATGMSIGADLRHAREQRGWSLDQLSSRTRIAVSKLAAMEANSFDRLPDGFYRRAFLRAYAREVGLDTERVVDAYRAQFANHNQTPTAEAASAHRTPASRKRLYRLSPGIQVLLLAILGTAAAIALTYMTERQTPSSIAINTQMAPANEKPHDGEQPAVGTGGASASTTSTAILAAIGHLPLEVEVQAEGPCWLGATADGERVVYRVLNKGERVTLQAHDELVLRIGDAGAFRFTINGIPGRRLGDAGDDLTLRLTPSNFRNYLQSP